MGRVLCLYAPFCNTYKKTLFSFKMACVCIYTQSSCSCISKHFIGLHALHLRHRISKLSLYQQHRHFNTKHQCGGGGEMSSKVLRQKYKLGQIQYHEIHLGVWYLVCHGCLEGKRWLIPTLSVSRRTA